MTSASDNDSASSQLFHSDDEIERQPPQPGEGENDVKDDDDGDEMAGDGKTKEGKICNEMEQGKDDSGEEGSGKNNENEIKTLKKEEKKTKSGVIYLSRVPPGIEPNTLRSLLAPIGKVGRIWLRIEDSNQRTNVKGKQTECHKHNKNTNYQDGWVEFVRKKDARKTVNLLNGQYMNATKKKNKTKFQNDLWCMKFLTNFTWNDLNREIFGGNARERILKVRQQIHNARNEKSWIEQKLAISNQIIKKKQNKQNKMGNKLFKQTNSVRSSNVEGEDEDDRKASKASYNVDKQIQNNIHKSIDNNLLEKLFR